MTDTDRKDNQMTDIPEVDRGSGDVFADLGVKPDAVAVTRNLAISFANWRQGQSDTPRCEPPGEFAIRNAEHLLREVIGFFNANETPLYTRPEAIPAEAVRALVEALEIARKTFAEYAELHSSKLDGALSLPEQAAIVSKVGRNRALEANCMHALATIKGYKL